jgi:hypothetical protein
MITKKEFFGIILPEKFPFGKTIQISNEAQKEPSAKEPIIPPGSRVSEEDHKSNLEYLASNTEIQSPEWYNEFIPLLRNLAKSNPDVSQALNNVVQLGNTGFKVYFDPRVSDEEQDKMRVHLQEKMKQWSKANWTSISGLTNKMLRQTMIGGAIVLEKVIANDLKQGISNLVFINPESIRFGLNKRKGYYEPYQKPLNIIKLTKPNKNLENLIKLNPHTLIYIGQGGDTSLPYGVPPYIPSLKGLGRQERMLDNFDHIIDVIGLFGFFQALLDKPDRLADESDAQYKERMYGLLDEAKKRIMKGYSDGVNVGFQGDTEFDFHTATRNVSGATDLYQENELSTISGLNSDASLLGRSYGSSEASITVVFMKMISQLTNIQADVAQAWEDIFTTELTRAGFNFKYLKVKFRPSTLADDYKMQQARQIKIANAQSLWRMGITSQDQTADDLDYEKPNLPEPRVDVDLAKVLVDKQKEQDSKNVGAKAKRRKDENIPKSTKDQRSRTKDQK